jgi:hypothetical protein
LILTEDERDDTVPVVLVPVELPAERAGHEVGHSKRQAIDMHVSAGAALLILPDAGLERWEMLVRLAPIALQSCGLMGDEPESANAGGSVPLLPLPIGFLALELDLGFEANTPGLPWPAAENVSPPVQAL